MKKLFIISNESIYKSDNNKFFCDNLDMKSTPEGLANSFEVNIISKKSKFPRSHNININDINLSSSIFSFLKDVIKSVKNEESKYLIVSITPYTFLACVFLKLFRKKPIVYLRSDGYGEYKAILGKVGPVIYHFMFAIVTSISNLISCREYILKGKKGTIIYPSQLDSIWLRKPKNLEIKSFKLLYVGRIRIEKGIFFFANLIKNKRDISLSIVGAEKGLSYNLNQSNLKILPNQNNKSKLIKCYDDHNIFILPSFTEGHPMVLLEALARRRPVVIFEDIKHVIGDKKGIFVAKRNFINFFGTLNHIKKNYKRIQKDMKKNKLPTNKEFIEKFVKSIDNFK